MRCHLRLLSTNLRRNRCFRSLQTSAESIAVNNADNEVNSASQMLVTTTRLKDRLWSRICERQHEIDELRLHHGSTVIGRTDINTIYGGMRDMPGLICETSLVDGQAGLLLQGMTIDQCRKKLPKFKTTGAAVNIDHEPMAEGVFWLLCTGEIPTKAEVESVQAEFHERAVIPESLRDSLNLLPRTMHPMTQLTIILMLMGSESETTKFFANNNEHLSNDESYHTELWHLFYEDCMNLLARLPLLCAFIYHRTYGLSPLYAESAKRADLIASESSSTSAEMNDWCGRFISLLGLDGSPDFAEFFRLSTLCHCDHENGSVYAHTNHILSSALTDPYRAYAGAVNGLAGPLHGLANQHALLLYKTLMSSLDAEYAKQGMQHVVKDSDYDNLLVENHVRKYLAQPGRVMPGYGHAVLRSHDPRYLAVYDFVSKRKLQQCDRLIRFERQLANIVPRLLMEKSSKVKCPWPNIDANSGVMLNYFGIPYHSFYTVFFAIAGCLGPMASTLWSRGLRLPVEQPDSLSTAAAMKLCGFKYLTD